MSGDDATTRKLIEERVKLQETRDALTKFLKVKKTTGDTDLAKCEKDKDDAAEAAKAAKTEATKTAQDATELATNIAKDATELATKNAEKAKVEATKNAEKAKVEATTKCDTEAELQAKEAETKRVNEILDLQNQLIKELAAETKFLDDLMKSSVDEVD